MWVQQNYPICLVKLAWRSSLLLNLIKIFLALKHQHGQKIAQQFYSLTNCLNEFWEHLDLQLSPIDDYDVLRTMFWFVLQLPSIYKYLSTIHYNRTKPIDLIKDSLKKYFYSTKFLFTLILWEFWIMNNFSGWLSALGSKPNAQSVI